LIIDQNSNIQALMNEMAILKQQAIPHQTNSQETVRRSIVIDPSKMLSSAPANRPLTAEEAARRSVYGSAYLSQ